MADIIGKLRSFGHAWAGFGRKIAGFVGVAIFALLFIVVVTPYAFVLRLWRKGFLPEFSDRAPSYYLAAEDAEPTLEQMRKQG
jgi:hypothetical protein